MKAALIQILMGAIGTLGFSIYFRVSERNVAAATFGGALGWGVYLLCFHLWGNVFAANVVATAVVYFWSVAMARVLKAPSNTYLIPGIIPLLPGGPLYYTMAGLVGGDRALFTKNGTTTILVTFGMVTGMVAAAVVFYYSQAAAEMQPQIPCAAAGLKTNRNIKNCPLRFKPQGAFVLFGSVRSRCRRLFLFVFIGRRIKGKRTVLIVHCHRAVDLILQ